MPTFARIGVAKVAAPGPRPGKLQALRTVRGVANFRISGQTLDSGGSALASCIVQLFRTGDDSLVAETTSDGSGNYSFTLPYNSGTFYAVAYKQGSPDVMGTTVNTLVAAQI